MWEIVYFVTNGSANAELDARVTPGINISSIGPVLDPSGAPYRILMPPEMYWRYEFQAFSVFLNNKLDKQVVGKFERAIQDEIEDSIKSK